MLKTKALLSGVLVTCMAVFLVFGCAPMQPKPSSENFITPTVSLSHVDVANYWGWWYYAKSVEPTKGKPDDRGAPFILGFVFEVTNPNEYPVLMDGCKFTIAFEEFDVNTVNSYETMWIPSGKTNQVRVSAAFDARTTLLSLGVTGGFRLKEKNISLFDQLETWWAGVSDFSFPIYVKEGATMFSANGITAVASFEGSFPE